MRSFHLRRGSKKACGSCPYQRVRKVANLIKTVASNAIRNIAVKLAHPDIEDEFKVLLQKLDIGLRFENPELSEEGVNGTYFIKNPAGEKIAVFKPRDEEASSLNNPKYCEEHRDLLKKGVPNGDAALREVAAYLLDREGFFGVPKTTLVEVTHPAFFHKENDGDCPPKLGSVQEYIENDGASWDVGVTNFPANEVHKIGILDIQIFNTDRHEGNILLKKLEDGSYKLIPIDHGFSLPCDLAKAWFEWLHWPQSKVPFSEKTKEYISRIDPERDIQMLKERLGIEEKYLQTMKISTMLLKKGCEKGLTLFQIASMICRNDEEEPCDLERMVEIARSRIPCGDVDFSTSMLETFSQVVDEHLCKE